MSASGWLIAACAALSAVMAAGLAVFGLLNFGSAEAAIALMAASLWLTWVLAGGVAARRLRQRLQAHLQQLPGNWQLHFVLFATLLALAEEAITTTLTNLAPAFGSQVGVAYITASSSYLEVVLYNSVIVFVPMFIVWAWLLRRYAFSPNSVLLLFGITGVLAEAIYGGAQALLAAPFWILVYGLMVYLPAYTLAQGRGARPPRSWHYALAVLLPLAAAAVMALLVLTLSTHLPHFGPDFTK